MNCECVWDEGQSVMLRVPEDVDCFETPRWLGACRDQTVREDGG